MNKTKIFSIMMVIVVMSFISISSVLAEQEEEVTLNEEQMTEMRELQQQALEQEITIINKYVEYGVFAKEKGDKIIEHLEKKYEKLEENDFIPQWDRKHGKKGE